MKIKTHTFNILAFYVLFQYIGALVNDHYDNSMTEPQAHSTLADRSPSSWFQIGVSYHFLQFPFNPLTTVRYVKGPLFPGHADVGGGNASIEWSIADFITGDVT